MKAISRGLLAAFAFMLLTVGACGSSGFDGNVLTVEQALEAQSGQTIRVQGHLLSNDAGAVLASALLESYPPQAGGGTIRLSGLDLAVLVGLSSTAGQGDLAQVSWSDYPVVLEGIVEDRTLLVTDTPPSVEAATPEVRVRFSPGAVPLPAGQTVWWVFDVTNTGSGPIDLSFATGQMAEVVVSQEGEEVYRWSTGKAFTQAVSTKTLEPADTLPIVLNDPLSLPAGDYDLVAWVTASVGENGSGSALPQVSTKISVR